MLRRRTLLTASAGLLVRPANAAVPPSTAPVGLPLTFFEDFDAMPDFRIWDTAYPWGARWLDQGELQVYVDPSYMGTTNHALGLNPFSVNNSILSIRANPVPPSLAQAVGVQRYTSGLLTTHRSFSQTFGYFEMRARLPFGRGLWPAFWMGPQDMSWPPEIDIMEAKGSEPTTLYNTLHTPARRPIGFTIQVADDMTAGFHRYGVLWTNSYVAWYFDGRRVAYTPTTSSDDTQKPMYMLINLALGGMAGNPDNTTTFPANLEVDYVCAYDCR